MMCIIFLNVYISVIYISPEKINWNRYFDDMATIKMYAIKKSYTFWKPVKFPIVLYVYIFIWAITSKNKLKTVKTTILPYFETIDATFIISCGVLNFFPLKKYFDNKQITYSDRTCSSLSPCMFPYFLAFIYWKMVWVEWKYYQSTSTENLHFWLL